jgi:PAS domain S-box-containing protein
MGKQERLLQNLLRDAKHELLFNEKRSRTLIEKSIDMILLAEPEGKLLYTSPAIINVLQHCPEEILDTFSLDTLIHADDLSILFENIQEILQTPGRYIFCEQRFLHNNGTWIWCEGSITNMLTEPGINALVFNFRDITEKKLAIIQLEKSEKKFREFFENAPQGIIIFDVASFTFVECNANALKILKFSKEEIFCKGPSDLSPEFQPDGSRSDKKVIELVTSALNGEKPVFEWLAINGEGTSVSFEVRLDVLSDLNQPKLYASFVDITERKKTEKKLQEQNKRLSEIAFLQSHQVRQPIAGILGLIGLFNFENSKDPINVEILIRMKEVTKEFDKIISEIVTKTRTIENECSS